MMENRREFPIVSGWLSRERGALAKSHAGVAEFYCPEDGRSPSLPGSNIVENFPLPLKAGDVPLREQNHLVENLHIQ